MHIQQTCNAAILGYYQDKIVSSIMNESKILIIPQLNTSKSQTLKKPVCAEKSYFFRIRRSNAYRPRI